MKGRRLAAVGAIAFLALAGALVVACGGGTSASDPTPVTTWPITPASGTPRAQATAAEAVEAPDGDNVLRIMARNIQFDKAELTATAGEVTVIFDNQDGGQPHNIRFFKGTDVRGERVGDTPIKNGPAVDTLTMTLEPDQYYYHCDAHPNMNGILTVTE